MSAPLGASVLGDTHTAVFSNHVAESTPMSSVIGREPDLGTSPDQVLAAASPFACNEHCRPAG
jgi:hypothetical protein